MMPLAAAPEPVGFDALVRIPGQDFLSRIPRPSSRDWRTHNYWVRAAADLREAYRSICAYSCHWIPFVDGQSVDHFEPKATRPFLAYEWTNYRFVFGVLNGCKGAHTDVIDPFDVQPGWFVIRFPSLLVVPGDDVSAEVAVRVRATCERLRLNDENRCLRDREDYIREYCSGRVTFGYLEHKAPFLASELRRQALVDDIKMMMKY